MTKQLITLIGALVAAAVLAAAVLVGVVPLVGGVFTAAGQRQQVETTNAGYEAQIADLTAQNERLDEIESGVEQLRAQIPDGELLNQVFDRISRAGTSAGVEITGVSRGDLAPYAARTGTTGGADAPGAPAEPAEQTETGTPIDDAAEVADDAAAAATPEGAAAEGTDAATPAATEPSRQQVELTIRASATDISSAFAFLDGLRAGPRGIAIDSVTTTRTAETFDMQITVIAFLHDDGDE
ncbi:hypothetical protein [Microbacterium esteraromaticum]|uniref:hypothetical protein n=1 Tax=Microbacterium esteraromaticum TaxID=57043 RepID=UPI00195A6F97|nr:hypothetical protein [Microbacterium esteraromaticum]MBM7465801.1 TolA-binding protein [Microbacterium esteraromaticum]